MVVLAGGRRGECLVPIYRFYRVDASGEIVSHEDIECANDRAAIERAHELYAASEEGRVEVWHGPSRRVYSTPARR